MSNAESFRPTVLVVADEPLLLLLYARVLESAGLHVCREHDLKAAVERLSRADVRPLLVLLDLKTSRRPEELGRHLAQRMPAVPVLHAVTGPDHPASLAPDDHLAGSFPSRSAPTSSSRWCGLLSGFSPHRVCEPHGTGSLLPGHSAGDRAPPRFRPRPPCLAPMLTPGQTIAPPPSQTPSPIETGRANSSPEILVAASSGWAAV
jgi:CheY-like chemotaxis protein